MTEYTKQQALVALETLEISSTQLAAELDVTPQAIYRGIRNPRMSHRIARRIRELIEQAASMPDPLHDLRKAS